MAAKAVTAKSPEWGTGYGAIHSKEVGIDSLPLLPPKGSLKRVRAGKYFLLRMICLCLQGSLPTAPRQQREETEMGTLNIQIQDTVFFVQNSQNFKLLYEPYKLTHPLLLTFFKTVFIFVV